MVVNDGEEDAMTASMVASGITELGESSCRREGRKGKKRVVVEEEKGRRERRVLFFLIKKSIPFILFYANPSSNEKDSRPVM